MNGPQHYREGEQHLSAASHLDKPGGRPVDPNAAAFHVMSAQAHFAAAQVAVMATQLADRYVGDGDHINEWRTAIGDVNAPVEDPWAAQPTTAVGPAIPNRPYSPPVETALHKLSLAGHVTPADTLAAAIPVIAGHIAEALIDGENNAIRAWARSIADELKRVGLNLHGPIEARAEDLSGKPFAYNTDLPLGYSNEPPF